MTDPFYVRQGLEGLLDKLYLSVDRRLQKKGININDDNGPIINNMWYVVHFLRKSPDFFKYLRKSGNMHSIPRLFFNVISSYFSPRIIMQEVEENDMKYYAFNFSKRLTLDEIIDSADNIKVVVSACAKGRVFRDDDSAPRKPEDIRICPLRHTTDCVYSETVPMDGPCAYDPCRVGQIYKLTNSMDNAETRIIFHSYSLMENGDMSIFNHEKGNFYIVEICPATLKRMEMAARMYPDFKGVAVTFSPGSSCRTLYDRPIRWGGDRDRIITRFCGNDPTIYLLEKLSNK